MLNALLKKLKDSLLYSINGGRLLFKHEKSIVLELTILPIISAVVSIFFGNFTNFAVLMAINLVVLSVEALNSAIEKTCDLITKEHNELIKYAKDAASFAVFCVILIYTIYSIYIILT